MSARRVVGLLVLLALGAACGGARRRPTAPPPEYVVPLDDVDAGAGASAR